jgi:F-box protein 9
MDPNGTNTEAELDAFRRKWKEEVSARSQSHRPSPPAPRTAAPGPSSSKTHAHTHAPKGNAPDAASHTHARHRSVDEADDVVPHVFHDLGGKQHGRRLDETSAETDAALAATREPKSALEHYERAVEKETQGSLGDSVSLYRKAFKVSLYPMLNSYAHLDPTQLDDNVHETYKAKHFPPSFFKNKKPATTAAPLPESSNPHNAKPHDANPSNASVTVPNPAHHSLQGLSSSYQTLLTDFATLSIEGQPAPTDLSPAPPCPISRIPEEILVEILEHLAVRDLAAFARLAQVCKRLAYLVATEDRVWKRIATGSEYGFGGMHYTWTCQLNGQPLGDDEQGGTILGTDSDSDIEIEATPPSPALLTETLVPSQFPTFRALFRQRPRVRFNGCYISTVNYTRPGAASTMTLTWGSPIHIVTYYRYLRFLRDGTCISLLTTAEPSDVVPHLYTEHMHKNHGALPSAPMKDALLGRWRLTGPETPGDEDSEKEGALVVETAGAHPKYTNKMLLSIGSAGRGVRNNKLAWQGYWSYNLLTDDWGEYGLKNDRPFYWSRVKSYGMSLNEKGVKF